MSERTPQPPEPNAPPHPGFLGDCYRNFSAASSSAGDHDSSEPNLGATDEPAPRKDSRIDVDVGDLIEGYRLTKFLGQGGMGRVFLSVTDDEYAVKVAVKALMNRTTSAKQRAAFDRERRILAGLEHPNITRFLAGGVFREVPWLAMEYVDGRPITRYCDQEKVDLEQRLRLFLEVCEGVSYAHHQLVIHRDIKPENILVDARGVPKLLDFGIAGLIDRETGIQSTGTHNNLGMMTPRYAAPEQWMSQRVGVSCDIYSLGVLLYELLCGMPPYDLPGGAPGRWAKIVLEHPPAKLSERINSSVAGIPDQIAADRNTTPAAMSRYLRGDLDSILAKALEKDPADRFASVEAMAGEIERFLAGLPIETRPKSLRYRTLKFMKRNVPAVAVIGGFIAMLIIFLFLSFAQQAETRVQRDLAMAEKAGSDQVMQYIESLFAYASPERALGNPVTAREVLEQGAASARIELAGRPRILGRVFITLARVFISLGEPDKAESLLREILAMPDALPEAKQQAEAHTALAAALQKNGKLAEALEQCRLAVAYQPTDAAEGNAVHIEALLQQVSVTRDLAQFEVAGRTLETLQPLLADEPQDSELRGRTLLEQAHLAEIRGQYETALQALVSAEAFANRVWGDRHPRYAEVLAQKGRLHHERGAFAKAESFFQRCLMIREALWGDQHPAVGEAYHQLGELYFSWARFSEAAHHYERALVLRQALLGEFHPDIGATLIGLAQIESALGRREEAEEQNRRAMVHLEWGLGSGHPRQAKILNSLASLYRTKGDLTVAEKFLRQSLAINIASLGDQHPKTQVTRTFLSSLLAARGRWDEAHKMADQAVKALLETTPRHHLHVAEAQTQMAGVLMRRGESEASQKLIEEAVSRLADGGLEHHPDYGDGLVFLGNVYYQMGKHAEAAKVYHQAKAVYDATLGHGSINTARTLNNIALVEYSQGDYQQALASNQKAREVLEKLNARLTPSYLDALTRQAGVLFHLGKYREADRINKEAQGLKQRVLGEGNINQGFDINNRAEIALVLGEPEKAERLQRQANAIFEKVWQPTHPGMAHIKAAMAAINLEQGRRNAAVRGFAAAIVADRIAWKQLPDWVEADPQAVERLLFKVVGGGDATAFNRLQGLFGATDHRENLYTMGMLIKVVALLQETGQTKSALKLAAHLEPLLEPHRSALFEIHQARMWGEMHFREGLAKQALPRMQAVLAWTREELGENHPEWARLKLAALTYAEAKNQNPALLKQAEELCETIRTTFGDNHAATLEAETMMGTLMENQAGEARRKRATLRLEQTRPGRPETIRARIRLKQ